MALGVSDDSSLSPSVRPLLDHVLRRMREELGMEVAYLTEFRPGVQAVRQVSADRASAIEEGLEVELGASYCQRVVDGRLGPVVGDTTREPQTRGLAVTEEAGIGAYVGVPVRLPDGELYGTLCCISGSDRSDLAERDIAFTQVLSRMIGDILDRDRREATRRRVLEDAVLDHSAQLRATSARLARSEAELVRRLSLAVEYRDDDTGGHVERVSRHCGSLAARAGLDAETCDLIAFASALHDVGKVAIPDAVLLKPGRLSAEERAVIERHTELGYELLKGSGSAVLQMAATIARSHHERYDGTGYPHRIAGRRIPVEGRIVAIVDVYDALSSDRVYRPAFAPDQVRSMLTEGRGTQFDPDLLDIFLAGVENGA